MPTPDEEIASFSRATIYVQTRATLSLSLSLSLSRRARARAGRGIPCVRLMKRKPGTFLHAKKLLSRFSRWPAQGVLPRGARSVPRGRGVSGAAPHARAEDLPSRPQARQPPHGRARARRHLGPRIRAQKRSKRQTRLWAISPLCEKSPIYVPLHQVEPASEVLRTFCGTIECIAPEVLRGGKPASQLQAFDVEFYVRCLRVVSRLVSGLSRGTIWSVFWKYHLGQSARVRWNSPKSESDILETYRRERNANR